MGVEKAPVMSMVPDMRQQNFILDVSWLAYRSHYTFGNFSYNVRGEEISTGVMYGLIRTVHSLQKSTPDCNIFLAVDSYPQSRMDAIPEYKKGRSGDGYDVHADLAMFLPYLAYAKNVWMVKVPDLEADDLLCCIPQTYRDMEVNRFGLSEWYIHANDMDSWQAVTSNVFLFDTFDKGRPIPLGSIECELKYGVRPVSMPMLKAIRGKPSDNMGSIIERFPKDLACKVATKFPTPDLITEEGLNSLKRTYNVTKAKCRYLDELVNLKDLLTKRYIISKSRVQSVVPFKHLITPTVVASFQSEFGLRSMRALDGMQPDEGGEPLT